MTETRNAWSFGLLGIAVMAGQAWLLTHNLIDSKPYKINDPSHVFFYTARLGVPTSLILSCLLTYFMSVRIIGHLLPMVPVIAFPILAWFIYQFIFAWTGLDFFSGSGDFSVMENEEAFAYDIVKVLALGFIGGLSCVAAAALIMKIMGRQTTDPPGSDFSR